ncbi:type I restriction endonuclease subunit R [Clostridiisalibacter paucivorans]|uniref:type I restriction endonuclease subunit R n=1 Tax=Clostridiisalibacter paucivorans TaxID=408753 RepID=UPI00047BA915|nr:HsdR family type I site-specific deoxyribonuclease [Clostridiisalibacter paucivorans]
MYFDKETDFEEAVIKALIECGWESEVIRHPSEKDLLKNWAEILFNNNRQKDRLNECPLTDGEMQQIMEQINLLQSPIKLNGFINGKSVAIKRDNPDDKEHFGKEISLKIYDRQEIAYGESRYQIVQQPDFPTKSPILNNRRGDLMLLINGMPVIHIELKKSGIPVSEAYNQIEKYSHEGVFRGLFSLIQVFVAMQPEEAVYFANPGEGMKFNKAFYFHWANFNNQPINKWDEVISKLLNIPMAHMLIGFYTIADADEGTLKVMRSYQYYAAIGIADMVAKKNWKDNNQLGGHVWHTTGSGKTMTSFKSAQLIASSHDADKVIFLVDRKELGIQSLKEYRSFSNKTESVQATENTDILISKLRSDDLDNTLIVTSIQKLSNISEEALELNKADLKIIQSKRIAIIIDECHRSTFGEMLTTIKNTFKNSIIFGFTGTPIQDVNIKKDSTTPTIFGDEIHRYTLADGIRDKNVLGFDPYMVKIYDDSDLRQVVALEKAKASTVEEVMGDPQKEKMFFKYMDSSQIKMYGENIDGKWVKGIEDFIPNEQYQTPEYRDGVITDIKKKWTIYSRGRKFHAIFATSGIPEAVAYYRLMKAEMPELSITAVFDPTIDNEGGGSLEKEDGIVEILEDYNAKFSQSFTIPSYDKFRKDVSLRLAHKKPYDRITRDEQIDIVIVVNQMLTGFDSKWVNTLYLDKVMEYENLIQAFSRTNRLYNLAEKPFGIIKYYRRPNTMEKNIEAAVKAYSGDIPTGLFVDKLPNNLRNMNFLYDEIEILFKNAGVTDFDRLPDETSVKAKFAKLFKQFSTHLEAAIIQGFIWSQQTYDDEDGNSIVMHFDEMTYYILLARYKELAKGGGSGPGGDVPYEIDTHITEYDTEKIDADYMNSRFEKFMKLIQSEYDAESFDKTLKELHKSFSMLSQEEQKYANIFIHDIQAGNISIIPGKSFREYISEMMKSAENERIKRVVRRLGCYEKLLHEMLERKVTKETIEAHGKFDELKATVDPQKARSFFLMVKEDNYKESRLAMYIDRYLRHFLLTGGEDPYNNVDDNEGIKEKKEIEHSEKVGVVLTEEKMKGKSSVSSVKSATLNSYYSKSNALACMLETDCFAYVEDKLCIYDSKYIQRDENGRIFLTNYAKEHEEECFLQFVVDDETGELHYITLPAAMASKSFNYYDEISEDLLTQYGLVNEISNEMLIAISGLDFGNALKKLMSKHICNYSVRLLKSTTGLDNNTISNLRKSANLTKLNVVSTCLGISIPFRVSNKMLQLAEISLNSEIPGKKGQENGIYDTLLHLKWATDYDDIYEELKEQTYHYLIHQPPMRK